MPKDCKECESLLMADYANLKSLQSRQAGYVEILERALDVKEELNGFLRREIEELQTKLKVYKDE